MFFYNKNALLRVERGMLTILETRLCPPDDFHMHPFQIILYLNPFHIADPTNLVRKDFVISNNSKYFRSSLGSGVREPERLDWAPESSTEA